MASASARPDNLDAFSAAAAGVHESLAPSIGRLGEALDAFRGTAGWSDWLPDVPPLDIDVAVLDGRIEALGLGVAATAAAFRRADADPGDGDGLATVGDESTVEVVV